MWAEVNGERKKVACGPCIRGHRSSKCDHRDRVLVEVRKPGRPLSSCPHPTGSCSCERVVINYTIPKSSECGCPSERAPPTATVVGNSRISKPRRKSAAVTTFNLEKAIRTGLDADTETSSITHTPSETSGSNAASLPSSASSTPRLLPAQHEAVSSCCKPKPALSPVQEGGCCGKKPKPAPEPTVQKMSCCSGSKTQASALPGNPPPIGYQHVGQQYQYPAQPQFDMSQYQNFQPQTSTTPTPFGLGTPIYNHAAAAYHQPNSMPLSPVVNTPISSHGAGHQVRQHVPEHNCHCGESCSCFGCAAHPNNATMMEYIRVMDQFQCTGGFGGMAPPFYDIPTYPHQAGYGAEATQGMSFNLIPQAMATPTPTQMNFSANISIANGPLPMPSNWQQQQQPMTPMTSMSQPQFPSNTAAYHTSSAPIEPPATPLKTEEVVSSPVAGSPAESKDEETSTLSPSSYFWNQVTLPSCSDASGTCQCGDGCACVGCLTHGGHTGEQLEDMTTAFGPSLGAVNMNDPSDFINFTTGPA